MTDQDAKTVSAADAEAAFSGTASTVDFGESGSIVGQTLDGRFRIERDLTKGGADVGGMGLVYLARDVKLLDREVVVKILQKTALENRDILRKFEHEQEALIRLDHPNIVRILDKGTLSDGNPFMVMDYISGYSLRKRLRDVPTLGFAYIAHIVDSVAKAMHAANRQKIFHRDIKPENIMLTPQEGGFERVRLIDFGIARVEESQVAPVTTIPRGTGTIKYIAPEQLRGELELTPASDIYSLAVMIYEMLTGEMPFKPRSVVEMFEMQKAGVQVSPSTLRPELPPNAEAILLSALSFEPSARPQSALAFGTSFTRALLERPEDVTLNLNQPVSIATADIDVPKKKSKLMWLLPVLLVVVFGGIGGGYLMMRRSVIADPVDAPANLKGVARTLQYHLNVQKMRDGKAFEAPFKSSGQEIFEDGYKFSLVLSPDADGNLYVLSEGKGAEGTKELNLLYPTPSTKNGSARVSAGESIATSQNTFSGGRGTEIVWIVWTKDASPSLEAIRASAFANGGLVEPQIARNYGDLESIKANGQPKKDSAAQTTILSGNGDIVAYRIELEHR